MNPINLIGFESIIYSIYYRRFTKCFLIGFNEGNTYKAVGKDKMPIDIDPKWDKCTIYIYNIRFIYLFLFYIRLE